MSSPVYALFRSMLHETSARNEGSVCLDDAIRKRLLTGVFAAYYAEATPETAIFDTNRGWTTKLPALVELFPRRQSDLLRAQSRLGSSTASASSAATPSNSRASSATTRAARSIRASRVSRRPPACSASPTMRCVRRCMASSRTACSSCATKAWSPTRSACYTRNLPGFIGEDLHPHDPRNIEPCYDMIEFDLRLRPRPGCMTSGAQSRRGSASPSCPRISSPATRRKRSGKT